MVAIAVPVLDSQGRFLAALAFHGPCMRLTLDKLVEGKPVLLEAARRLSAIMMMDD